MLTLHHCLPAPVTAPVDLTLALSADERQRSRCRLNLPDGQTVVLRLPRGTVLQAGDCLQAESGELVSIVARPEPVLRVTATTPHDLLRAAYHLGNRHVPLAITPDSLCLAPDPVLEALLRQLGLHVTAEITPFCPEAGAYAGSQASAHSHA
ncbi:MAG: urease accessory protein UreE [Spirulinaceae cyanobacterium SM2_1_0]|nr:urease accessory protein UreE [Spirulinaceae cyanobacterium SM2_1_0]